MKIQYLGHSAFYIETPKLKGLIDPFITDKLKSPAFTYADINYIFVTHGHGDHLGSAIEIANQSKATIVANHEMCYYLSKFNINCHSMHIGGRTDMDFGKVKMTTALHGSGITTDQGMIYGGNPCGFIIDSDGKKLYHAGDTGLTMDMKLLAEENIDIALLPIGGNFTMDIDDAVKAVEFIQPKIVIPMHYNTFPVIAASAEDFKTKLQNYKVEILGIGDLYQL